MSDIMNRRLELGEVTDGAGKPSHCDAVIFFANMYDSPEITINAPDAPLVAARIVDLWNAALALPRPVSGGES